MSFNKILVTLDGSTLAENAVKQARAAGDEHTHITLLSIAEETWAPSLALASASGIAAPMPSMATGAHEQTFVQQMRNYLERVAEPLTRSGMEVSCEIRTGNVIDIIVDEATRGGYDLIVMSTHGRTGFSRMLLGSVVADVLPLAPCPVLVVPPHHNTPHA